MNRVNRIGIVAALAAISAAAVAGVAGSEAEATKAIDARIALFKDIKKANEPLGLILRNQLALDNALVATNAAKLKELALKIPAAYDVDTRKFPAIKTEAKEGIWNSLPEFKTKADALATAADELAAAAKAGGDIGALRPKLAAVGKTCGACHDAFRNKT